MLLTTQGAPDIGFVRWMAERALRQGKQLEVRVPDLGVARELCAELGAEPVRTVRGFIADIGGERMKISVPWR